MTAAPRISEGYEPDFDIDSRRGHQGEVYISNIIQALTDGTAEVKRDDRSISSGNVFIEYACQRRDGWQPSGIATTKAFVWVYVIGGLAVAAPTRVVLDIARKYHPERKKHMSRGSHPTLGIVLPLGLYVDEVRQHPMPSLLTTPSLADTQQAS